MKTTTIKDFLEGVKRLIESNPKKNGWKYSCIEDFVLRNGQSFSKSLLKIKRGRMKACFRNAFRLADNSSNEFLYVEGYATSMIDFPVLHAWCLDKDGKVVDPTWKDGKEYFGVPFNLDYVRRTIFKRKRFGVIDNFEMGFPLISGSDSCQFKI